MPDAYSMPSDTEVLLNLVLQRYGQRLTSDEQQEVCQGIEAIAQAARALRSAALANSDEPLAYFSPYRQQS